MKQLVRTIALSHSYRLDAAPHAGNAGDMQTFARFYPRRLSAEVLLDGVSQKRRTCRPFSREFPPAHGRLNCRMQRRSAFSLPPVPTDVSLRMRIRVDAPALAQGLEW